MQWVLACSLTAPALLLTCQLLFHIFFLPSAAVYLPYALLRALVPFLRPHRRWTVQGTMAVLMTRLTIHFMVFLRMQPIQPREGGLRERPGALGTLLAILNNTGPGGRVAHPLLAVEAARKIGHKQGGKRLRNDRVWFDAPPLAYYRGLLSLRTPKGSPLEQRVEGCPTYNGPAMVDVAWAKNRTRAFWFMPHGETQHPPAEVKGGQKEPVILYFHGGAAVTFSAGDMFMGATLAANLAKTSQLAVFSVDYNLAPYAPFPVPIVQALGGYLYLTEKLGYRPDQIIIGGDSFGAHLTLGLERFLRLEGPAIGGDVEKQGPVVAGLLLLSPWLAVNNGYYKSRPDNLAYDIVTVGFSDWGLKSMQIGPDFVKRCNLSLEDPWLSPVNKEISEYSDMPPMFVVNGQLEVLVDEGREFAEKARKAGADVTHVIVVSGLASAEHPCPPTVDTPFPPPAAPAIARLFHNAHCDCPEQKDLPRFWQVGQQETLLYALLAVAALSRFLLPQLHALAFTARPRPLSSGRG